jgi:2'-5' RNA ligase
MAEPQQEQENRARRESRAAGVFENEVGDSALLVALPDLDAYIEPWRGHLPSDGIDAHMTVLVPFLTESRIDEAVLAGLRGIFRAHRAFDVEFARTGCFPGCLYLAPEPDRPMRELIRDVVRHWPECPPYGGEFADPTPHLTVVFGSGQDVQDAARQALAPHLPIRTRATAVDLVCFDGERWVLRERFPLAG